MQYEKCEDCRIELIKQDVSEYGRFKYVIDCPKCNRIYDIIHKDDINGKS